MKILLTRGDLETIHTHSKNESLKSFKDYQRIKVVEKEDNFKTKLVGLIEKELDTYKEKTIESKMEKVSVPMLSMVSIAGIVVGTVVESPIILGGAFLGLLFGLWYQIRKPRLTIP